VTQTQGLDLLDTQFAIDQVDQTQLYFPLVSADGQNLTATLKLIHPINLVFQLHSLAETDISAANPAYVESGQWQCWHPATDH
jgi:hypothetical protein